LSPESVFGLLNLNKPVGPTSHDVVARVRRLTGIRKIGHAGTLDPLAGGVLVLCLGPATRLSEYVMRSPKQYRAAIQLGITTTTYDAEGEIVSRRPLGDVDHARITAALAGFTGEIEQVPPMYSAVKQGGKRLYALARAGEEVDRPARRVTIQRIDVVGVRLPDLMLEVTCSPGTYIRSLAHDLGQVLGPGATLTGLIRLASGAFPVEEAVSLEAFEMAAQAGHWQNYLLPPDRSVLGLQPLFLDEREAEGVLHGRAIPAPVEAAGEARAYGPDGTLLAIVTAGEGLWRATKVFQA
jgi:tRNA pseudouridine55 synthase